jgi:hypothetical protein
MLATVTARYRRVPQLVDICRQVATIDVMLPLRDLLSQFQEDSDRLAVAVVAGDRQVGLVCRKALFSLINRPFAREIYLRRPVYDLLQDLPQTSFAMPPDRDIHSATIALLGSDPQLVGDVFPLEEDSRCTGIVAVADLFRAVISFQQHLLAVLAAGPARHANPPSFSD